MKYLLNVEIAKGKTISVILWDSDFTAESWIYSDAHLTIVLCSVGGKVFLKIYKGEKAPL